MFKFKYDKIIDSECWQRVIDSNMVDRYVRDENAIEIAKKMASQFIINDEEIESGFREIFKCDVPPIVCYFTTCPYSMDKYPDYISVSAISKFDKMGSFLHETNHYMLRHSRPNTPNIEEVKEIIAVVNEDVFKVRDSYWKKYEEQRKIAMREWQKSRDIDKVIKCVV